MDQTTTQTTTETKKWYPWYLSVGRLCDRSNSWQTTTQASTQTRTWISMGRIVAIVGAATMLLSPIIGIITGTTAAFIMCLYWGAFLTATGVLFVLFGGHAWMREKFGDWTWVVYAVSAMLLLYVFFACSRSGGSARQQTTSREHSGSYLSLASCVLAIALLQWPAKKEVMECNEAMIGGDAAMEEKDFIGQEVFKRELRKLKQHVEDVQTCNTENGDNYKIECRDMHMVFYGNPGTGKTEGARLMAKVLAKHGFVNGKFTECNATELVGEARGQSVVKTRNIMRKARGGVLFIDEAYLLDPKGFHGDLGGEVISELLPGLENDRNAFICVLAGYKDDLKKMMSRNQGLAGRFKTWVPFNDYTIKELMQMLDKKVEKDKAKDGRQIKGDCRSGIQEHVKTHCLKKRKFEEVEGDSVVAREIPAGQARALRQLYDEADRKFIQRKAKYIRIDPTLCRDDPSKKLKLMTKDDFDVPADSFWD